MSSWILLIVIFAVNTLFYFSFGSRTFGNWWGSWYHVFVSDTGIVLTLSAMLFWGLFSLLYGNIRIGQLYRRLRKGIPMDHTPRRRNWFYKGIRLMSACAVVYSLTVMGFRTWAPTGAICRQCRRPLSDPGGIGGGRGAAFLFHQRAQRASL